MIRRSAGRHNKGFSRRRRGATAMTYSLVVGLVAIAGITAVTRVGSSVDGLFTEVASSLDNADRPGPGSETSPTASPSATPSPTATIDPGANRLVLPGGTYINCLSGLTADANSLFCDQPIFNNSVYEDFFPGGHSEGNNTHYFQTDIGEALGYAGSYSVGANAYGCFGTSDNEFRWCDGELKPYPAESCTSDNYSLNNGCKIFSSFTLYRDNSGSYDAD